MNNKKAVHTSKAPEVIGTYSQAILSHKTVYLSGQIPFDPEIMQMVDGDMHAKVRQIFKNLHVVCESAGGTLDQIVKLNVYLTDMSDFPVVNEVMAELFTKPYPARAAVAVKALPKGAEVEIDGILVLD